MERSSSCKQTISQSPKTQTVVRFSHSQDKPIVQGRIFNQPPSMNKMNIPNIFNRMASVTSNESVFKNEK
jgi:hypothetical protein